MRSEFLAELDAAVDGRCACLCGAAITAGSPSAYFAAEACSVAWHRATAPQMPLLAEVLRAARELLDKLVTVVRDFFDRFGAAIRDAVRDLAALTASAAPARPPQRIDPPAGLRSARRGGCVYRPRLR